MPGRESREDNPLNWYYYVERRGPPHGSRESVLIEAAWEDLHPIHHSIVDRIEEYKNKFDFIYLMASGRSVTNPVPQLVHGLRRLRGDEQSGGSSSLPEARTCREGSE